MVVEVGPVEGLSPERGRLVHAGGRDVALFLVDGEVRALDNRCEHAGGPLADGVVVDGCVICPLHGWVYDLATGQPVVGAGTARGVRAYEAWVEGGVVKVRVD